MSIDFIIMTNGSRNSLMVYSVSTRAVAEIAAVELQSGQCPSAS